MPKKRETRSTSSVRQPVRFYKFVALTFLFVTIILFGVILFMSSKRAHIIIVTKSEPIDANFSVVIGDPDSSVNGSIESMDIQVERVFVPESSKKEPGTAEGTVTFYNESGTDQQLIATTRLVNPDGILFRLKTGVVVPSHGTVDADVYADEDGTNGNIEPSSFVIPGLNLARQEDIYARSKEPMIGGVREVGVLGDADMDKARALLRDEAKAVAAEKLQVAGEGQSIIFDVASATFESDTEIGDETDGFTVMGIVTVVGVSYDADALTKYARSILEKQIVQESEILQSVVSNPEVTLAEFNRAAQFAKLNVVYSGRVNLDSDSAVLERQEFFGKDENDVRRYVMSLDHVQGVQINFRPIWNRSVPRTAEHVKITVQQID